MVSTNFLSMKQTFECIVNAFFCCLDIYKTRNFPFTLSQNEKKSIYQLRSL